MSRAAVVITVFVIVYAVFSWLVGALDLTSFSCKPGDHSGKYAGGMLIEGCK